MGAIETDVIAAKTNASTRAEPDTAVGPVMEAASPGRRFDRWVIAFVVLALTAGVVVRFFSRSSLWLDEALAVNIAHLPLSEIPEALRRDGAPPLYYLLLHAWIRLFGSGDVAVRALSGLGGVSSMVLAWLAGRRLAGRRVGWVAALLVASSPFAVAHAIEARMYSLLIALVLAGYLAVTTALRHPTRRWPLVATAAITGVLLLTHYWSMFVVAATAMLLAVRALRPDHDEDEQDREPGEGPGARETARRVLAAMVVGSLLFVPWVPSFLYQVRHTGAPWGKPGSLRSVFDTVANFAGGYWDPALPLGLLFYALIVLALFGHALDGRRVEIDLHTRGPGRHLAAVGLGTLVLGILSTRLTHSAFASRYTAVVFPFVILLVALGTRVLTDRRFHHTAVAMAVVLGFWAIWPTATGSRTNAPKVAAVLRARAVPGDVVAYCPDQVGPSVSRLLPHGIDQVTFPRATAPQFINWVDYKQVNTAAQPQPFTDMLLDRAGPHGTVWLVWSAGYRTFANKCIKMLAELEAARPEASRVIVLPSRGFEKVALARFPPS